MILLWPELLAGLGATSRTPPPLPVGIRVRWCGRVVGGGGPGTWLLRRPRTRRGAAGVGADAEQGVGAGCAGGPPGWHMEAGPGDLSPSPVIGW